MSVCHIPFIDNSELERCID